MTWGAIYAWPYLKGAPHVILEMCEAKETIRKGVEDKVLELAHRGIRSLAGAYTRPLFSSTLRVADTTYALNTPSSALTPPGHPQINP